MCMGIDMHLTMCVCMCVCVSEKELQCCSDDLSHSLTRQSLQSHCLGRGLPLVHAGRERRQAFWWIRRHNRVIFKELKLKFCRHD